MATSLKGSAYQDHEGPPMDYILEKLTNAIKTQYQLIQDIQNFIPNDYKPSLPPQAPESINFKNDYLLSGAKNSFYNLIKTFLALNNRLGLMDDNNLVENLLNQSPESFKSWLQRIQFVKSTQSGGYMEAKEDINNYIWNKLKTVNPNSLEAVMSEAISKLVGEDYSCNIDHMKFSLSGANLQISISQKLNLDEIFGKKESENKT